MRRVNEFTVACCGLALGVLVSGCGPGAKDLQIQALQDKRAELERANEDLRQQLGATTNDASTARSRALELQRLLDEANRKVGERPAGQEGMWTEVGPFAWTDIADDVLFDSGKAVIKPDGKEKLRQVAQEIKEKFGDRDVWVIGHTDTDPIRATKQLWKDNLDLSQGRSHAVALELMSLGIDAKRLIAGGQGEFNPKAPNDTKANKALNRRVQIVAVTRQPTPGPGGG